MENWSFSKLAIAVVVFLAICALVWLFIVHSGIPIPAWALTAFWIVVLAVVVVAAIRFLTRL